MQNQGGWEVHKLGVDEKSGWRCDWLQASR
jgi:hypothetical protein